MKNNWKEQIKALDVPPWVIPYGNIYDIIETEIIEKLIEDIPACYPNGPYGADTERMKQQLRAKWLGDAHE